MYCRILLTEDRGSRKLAIILKSLILKRFYLTQESLYKDILSVIKTSSCALDTQFFRNSHRSTQACEKLTLLFFKNDANFTEARLHVVNLAGGATGRREELLV